MAEYELNLKTNADASALDELLEKLQQLTEVEQETGEIIISPEADTAEVDELANSLFEVSKAEEEVKDKASETAGEIDIMADAISAAASLGLAAEFQNTANAADNYNVSMAALNTVAANNGIAMDNISSSISRVTDATTISGGQARSFFSLMMNMGVTSTDALADSLIYLQGQSAITGSSVEQMESKLTRLANSDTLGSRQLVALGLSLEQLAEANHTTTEQISSDWANMSADERLTALNNAMAENSGLVEEMNNTTSGQLAELGQAWAGLEIDVGQSTSSVNQAVLGMATGALTTLRDNLRNIPFASTFLGGALAAGSLATGMKPALDTFNTLSRSVGTVGSMMRGFASAINIVRSAESAGAAIKGVYNAALGVEATATAAKGTADAAATGPTAGLAVAENALLWPVLAVTAAILILIGILYYLYNNNEQVRQAVDQLVATMQSFINIVWAAIQPIIQFVQQAIAYFMTLLPGVQSALQPVFDFITAILAQGFITWINNVRLIVLTMISVFQLLVGRIQAIFNAVWNVISAAMSVWNQASSKAREISNAITSAFSGVTGRIQSAFSGVSNAITAPFQSAYNTLKPIIDNIKAAWDMLNGIGSSGVDVGSAGVSVGSAGINLGNANTSLMSTVSNTNGTTNISLNGIIEESAGDFIVRKLNDELYKQRVIRGV